jgi:phage/plasmid-like protein (TIGR03299 family)
MTTAQIDVNEAFAAEKADQIGAAYQRVEDGKARMADFLSGKTQAELDAKLAEQVASGKIRMVSPDRYEVLEGWDRNEYFSVQRARNPGEVALVLPEHGLDTSTGKVAVYSAVPMWHELGNAIPGGVSDIDEVLRLGGIAFTVKQAPAFFTDDNGKRVIVPGQFVNYRDDTQQPLGMVGKIYTPAQNREGFEFLQDISGKYGVLWESAGALRGGSKVFVSMRLPEDIRIDAEGVNDIVRPFLTFGNDHSGNGKVTCRVTPWRPICGNTERFSVRDAITTWGTRHTRNWKERAEEARRSLGLAVEYFDAFKAEEESLIQTRIELKAFDDLIAGLWEPATEDSSKRQVTIASRRDDQLHELFGIEAKRVGQNAYAAERAVTAWLDHAAPRRVTSDKLAAARATAVLEDADGDLKSKAHRQLLTLVNR